MTQNINLWYGHEIMTSRKNESNLFATWFRTLSMAYIGKVLKGSVAGQFDWQIMECPGYQFWR